jgi:hypothetical protein
VWAKAVEHPTKREGAASMLTRELSAGATSFLRGLFEQFSVQRKGVLSVEEQLRIFSVCSPSRRPPWESPKLRLVPGPSGGLPACPLLLELPHVHDIAGGGSGNGVVGCGAESGASGMGVYMRDEGDLTEAAWMSLWALVVLLSPRLACQYLYCLGYCGTTQPADASDSVDNNRNTSGDEQAQPRRPPTVRLWERLNRPPRAAFTYTHSHSRRRCHSVAHSGHPALGSASSGSNDPGSDSYTSTFGCGFSGSSNGYILKLGPLRLNFGQLSLGLSSRSWSPPAPPPFPSGGAPAAWAETTGVLSAAKAPLWSASIAEVKPSKPTKPVRRTKEATIKMGEDGHEVVFDDDDDDDDDDDEEDYDGNGAARVVRCFVFGGRGCGKSALLRALLLRPPFPRRTKRISRGGTGCRVLALPPTVANAVTASGEVRYQRQMRHATATLYEQQQLQLQQEQQQRQLAQAQAPAQAPAQGVELGGDYPLGRAEEAGEGVTCLRAPIEIPSQSTVYQQQGDGTTGPETNAEDEQPDQLGVPSAPVAQGAGGTVRTTPADAGAGTPPSIRVAAAAAVTTSVPVVPTPTASSLPHGRRKHRQRRQCVIVMTEINEKDAWVIANGPQLQHGGSEEGGCTAGSGMGMSGNLSSSASGYSGNASAPAAERQAGPRERHRQDLLKMVRDHCGKTQLYLPPPPTPLLPAYLF